MTANCPICASDGMLDFWKKEDHQLIICPTCRHITWSDIPSDEVLSAYYASDYSEVHNQVNLQVEALEYYKSHAQELADFAGIPINEFRIADVGCSIPVFLEQVNLAGAARAIGVDWSQLAWEHGRERGVEMLTPPDFEALEDESLDTLRYAHALEHMPDPVTALRTQARKLRVGGTLYITQPNFPVMRPAASSTDLIDTVWPTHLHFFSPTSLRRMLEDAGFEIRRYYSVGEGELYSAKYAAEMDIEHARTTMQDLAEQGDPSRGEANNYPLYAAENSAMYAIKLA